MRRGIWSSLVQIMVWYQIDAKPLSKPMPIYRQLDPTQFTFYSRCFITEILRGWGPPLSFSTIHNRHVNVSPNVWVPPMQLHFLDRLTPLFNDIPDSKVHGTNMGPTWVLSAPDGPRVAPMNLAIRDITNTAITDFLAINSIAHKICWRCCCALRW